MTSRSNPVEIPGWTHIYSGKVRDLYVPNEERFDATGLTVNDDAELRAGSVMVVASDRISAFDRILPTEIPDKGKILTQMSLWWFEQLKQVPNHVLSTDVPDVVAGRSNDLPLPEHVPGGVHCARLPDRFGFGCVQRDR